MPTMAGISQGFSRAYSSRNFGANRLKRTGQPKKEAGNQAVETTTPSRKATAFLQARKFD
ncbi:hypothetical protein [Trinickia fusca]|uniref:hypothetical protein n=1 Tax=Trinickia fusca TaxID=2419777 RepID=UPI0011C3EE69|nr:hypothetical protein [Trinickia fusca]